METIDAERLDVGGNSVRDAASISRAPLLRYCGEVGVQD